MKCQRRGLLSGAKHLAVSLALTFAACAPFIRSNEGSIDGGIPAFPVLLINGFLAPPGSPIGISPNPIATSPKFFLRKPSGQSPNCYYGVFVADPAATGQPNNGVLLSALGDMNKINGDPSLGGGTRSSCPDPSTYAVGGSIPDGIKIGDRLQVQGFFEPYCDYTTSTGGCEFDLFPEVTPDPPLGYPPGSIQDLGPAASPIPPLLVAPTDISDLATEAIQYAGELVTVQRVTVSSLPLDPYGDVVLDQGGLWLTALGELITIDPTANDVVDQGIKIPDAPGTAYCSVTGDLHFQFSHWKLRPRQQSDLVLCPVPDGGQCDFSLCPGG
ncbi:MAG: hypothetical protein ACYDCL_13055 [Myxococcales bacterium]